MDLSAKLKTRLESLPDKPGVYLMRDRTGRVIYVGKAASLRSRVRSYFRDSTRRRGDPKLRSLVHSIDDLEFIELKSEAEAVLIEGQFIKEYRPRYNIDFRDDKRFLLLRMDLRDPFPRLETGRIRREDGATYFGPYASSASARVALDFAEKRFGLRRCAPREPGPEDHRHCHNDVIRFCAAPCILKVTPEQYMERVHEACKFLRGEKPECLREIRTSMTEAAAALDFEKAAVLRDTLRLLHEAVRRTLRELHTPAMRAEDARRGLEDLRAALGLPAPPHVIEAYDISNISGVLAVASLVCAVDGIPRHNRYRMFRIKTVEGSDDPAMMAEVIRRRFRHDGEEKWTRPDLVLVDGGLTQLRAARGELAALGLADVPTAGLAKKFEEIHHGPPDAEQVLRLPLDSPALQILRRLRDEAHRFALTYHRTLRGQRIRESELDRVEGIGAKRKQMLLQHFGSILRLRRASVEDIAAVPGIGPVMAAEIRRALG